MRRAVVERSGNFGHLGFFNVHPNLSTQASGILASIENALCNNTRNNEHASFKLVYARNTPMTFNAMWPNVTHKANPDLAIYLQMSQRNKTACPPAC
uniref:Uncharacterized protein n=1 Tax=Rhipicephalus appendiculatus TaxID=34631 RepID=A0A131Z605_RHIAP